MLGIKENRAADFKGVELNSARYIHLLAEIEKRVFADRADYLGDPDFSKVPVARLTDPAYLKQRAAEVNPTAISPTEKVRPGLEPHQTTHFHRRRRRQRGEQHPHPQLGLRQRRGGQGRRLPAQRRDGRLQRQTGRANAFGVVGSDANAIEPGKRMLSMSPSIVTRDGKVSLVVGTPGGSRIFTRSSRC